MFFFAIYKKKSYQSKTSRESKQLANDLNIELSKESIYH